MPRLFKNHLLWKSNSGEGEAMLESLRRAHTHTHTHTRAHTHTHRFASIRRLTLTAERKLPHRYWNWRQSPMMRYFHSFDFFALKIHTEIYSGGKWAKERRKGREERGRQKQNDSIWYFWNKTKSSSGYSGDRHTVNVLFICLSAGALTGLMLQQSSLIEKGSALPRRVGCMSKWCCAWLILACVCVCVCVCRCSHLYVCVCFCESNWIKETTQNKKRARQGTGRRSGVCWVGVTHDRRLEAAWLKVSNDELGRSTCTRNSVRELYWQLSRKRCQKEKRGRAREGGGRNLI